MFKQILDFWKGSFLLNNKSAYSCLIHGFCQVASASPQGVLNKDKATDTLISAVQYSLVLMLVWKEVKNIYLGY